ncbi:hypothetical protein GF336_02190 [Candidatus Woesearchaeota archaeon]|nr:hypothetical protein [Candidatus Woesearchaeota archaeon]
MEFKEALELLKKSDVFKEWKDKNKECYLSFGFHMVEDKSWKIGYYDPSDDKVTSFDVSKEKVTIEPEEEVFKKEKTKVENLDPEKVKIDFVAAVKIAKDLQEAKYEQDKPTKIFGIIQHLDIGQVWNITFVTQRFNTLNVKVDAAEGDVKEENLASLMDWKAK